VLSGFFDTPPGADACAALLRAITAAASAPPPPPREPSPPPPAPPASSSAGGGGGGALSAFASDFAAALPDAWPYEDADEGANGSSACAHEHAAADVDGGGDDSDGEWWHAAELADDPQALWGGTDAVPTADAPWPWHFAPRADACGAPCEDDDAMAGYGDADVDGAAAADAAVAALAARFPSLEHATICAVMLSLNCDAAVRARMGAASTDCASRLFLYAECAARACTPLRAGHGGGAGGAGRGAAAAAAGAG
jgi:hypothetical protein